MALSRPAGGCLCPHHDNGATVGRHVRDTRADTQRDSALRTPYPRWAGGYPLSVNSRQRPTRGGQNSMGSARTAYRETHPKDRKSTRLNSSHQIISYAVFCLKKKNKTKN